MEKISTCLWFDGQAEQAMKFYTSVFKKSKKGHIQRWGEGGPGKKGDVLVASFQIEGRDFLALNGGPNFKFNESVSFVVNCKTQKEVDYYWKKLLSGGGQESQCGWLKDRFGVSWQVTPIILPKLLRDKNPKKSQNVMNAMMKMVKLDIKALEKAHSGK